MSRFGFLFAFLLGLAVTAEAAPTYNNDAAVWNGAAGAGTFGGTFTPSLGTNNVLIVVVSTELSINYTVTYGGAAVTLLRSDCSGTACQYIYYRINPAASGAIAADAVPDDWNTARVMAFTYSGVDQTTPFGANSGTNGAPGSSVWSLSNSITPTNSSSVLLELSNMQSGGCAPTASSTSLGTQRYTNYGSVNNTHGEMIADYAPGSSGTPVSFNHSYTCASGGAAKFEIAAVELLPPAAVGTSTNTSTITVSPTYTKTRTATPTMTPTVTPSFTASPIASMTRTPLMALSKTSNLSQAVLGDTLTFCIAWSNDSNAATTVHFWDTISPYLSYVGCANGCTKTGSTVAWGVAAAAGSSGQSCFWGTVSAYPP